MRFLLSCGEPSGDLYAGALTRELCSLAPGTTVAGLGGPQLTAAGGHLIEELFTDYRTVNGVKIAFTANVRQGGRSVLERRVTGIRINVPLDPALFQRPAS